MKNFKKLLVTLGAFGGLALAGTVASADTVYTVQSGDTLSEISQKFNTTVETLAQKNNINNVNVISVGQQLDIPDGNVQATSTQNVVTQPVQQTQVQQPQPVVQEQFKNVEPTQPVQKVQTTQTTQVASSGDNSNKALRRQIESGGNYNTNTGNGYVGAYQFAPSTIASIENATGMKWSMDPSTQDAFADYYANQRYGGWQNVPTTGGW